MANEHTENMAPQFVMDMLRLVGYAISKTFWFIRYTGRENIPHTSDRRLPACESDTRRLAACGPTGQENTPVPSVKSFLICANHQTYIDPVWVCLPMRRKLRFMAVDKAFEWRFIGPLIRYLGAFPVSLETGGTLKAMKWALRALSEGAVLTVFPEGAREFADGEFFPFKTGAVRIAMQAGVPILPVTINGGNRIWPQKQKYPSLFRRIEIVYHPLIDIIEDESLGKDANLANWTETLRQTIASAYRS